MKRGQGTFEYVLLLGAVLAIVVLAVVLISGIGRSAGNDATKQMCMEKLARSGACNSADGGWDKTKQFDPQAIWGANVASACHAATGIGTPAAPATTSSCPEKPQ